MKTEEFEEIDEKKLEECCGGGPKAEVEAEVEVEVELDEE